MGAKKNQQQATESGGGGGIVTEVELNDLRQKFQLLEGDRKAYYEISMRNMKQNKSVIAESRDKIKKLREDLKKLRRKNCVMKDYDEGEVGKLEKHVGVIRRNLDTVKNKVDEKRKLLESLRDKASELQADGANQYVRNASPENAKRIRSLENRLDRSIIKFNEAQSIKVTYEQIVDRLKEERDGFDAQMAALERTIHVKNRDMGELRHLQTDALQAKEIMMKDLEKSRCDLDKERKIRQRELRQRKLVAESAADVLASVESMGQAKTQALKRYDEEGKEKRRKSEAIPKTNINPELSPEELEKLNEYEAGFSKIMAASGVSDINEIIVKIVNQSENQANLHELIRENTKKIDAKTAEIKEMKALLEEARFSGIHRTGTNTRKRIDELEDSVLSATILMEQKRKRCDFLSSILINARAGIKHIMDKLRGARPDDGGKALVLNNDTIVHAVTMCEDMFVEMLEAMRSEAPNTFKLKLSESEDIMAAEELDLSKVKPYNQRVRLFDDDGAEQILENPTLRIKDGDSFDETKSEISYGSDDDGLNDATDPISRDHIKQASKIIIRHRGSPRSPPIASPTQVSSKDSASRRKNRRSSATSRKG